MRRSQSLPLEFSSLRKRSAKLVQGTDSNFIPMPVLAVKSLDSSTRAFAGSHAAQQRVNCFDCACADGAKASTKASTAATARALTRANSFSMIQTSPSFRLDGTVCDAAIEQFSSL